MNNITYISTMCSIETTNKYFANKHNLFPHQSQKFHSLLLKGLQENEMKVRILSIPPVNRNVSKRLLIKNEKGLIYGFPYQTISFLNFKIIKQIAIFINVFLKTVFNKSDIIVIDLLNKSAVFSVYMSSFIKKKYTVGILTDLPSFRTDSTKNGDKLTNISRLIYNRFDHYILLTEEMMNLHTKFLNHSTIIEGISNIDDKYNQSEKFKKKTCMYTGTLAKIYGISSLIEAFQTSDLKNVDLVIYGDGDFKEDIIQASAKYPNIIYKGSASNEIIVQEQRKVHLLINPRPNKGSYVKYSFPSKIMEYMSSGTPVLTVDLPGIPNEYKELLNLIHKNDPHIIKEAVLKIIYKDYDKCIKKAEKAREFVVNNKNSKFQAAKIVTVLMKEVHHV